MTETPVNVRVAVRVRPLLPGERLHSHQVCVKKVPKSKNQLIVGKDRSFTFDHLHWWNAKQQDVFKTTIKPLVGTYFQGYNATVFAYGQTGSGKTYTIGGSNPANITKEERGIIPRAIDDIFNEMKQNSRKHTEHCIKVSYVEIYKEEVRDLLEVDLQKCQDVHIREDQNGNTVIVGAREEICVTAEEVLSLLQKGSAVRHTGVTQMNELSSRSHAIFSLHMIQTWPNTPRPKNENNNNSSSTEIFSMVGSTEAEDEKLMNVMSSKFHFVDLAGSERANRTGNTGERFKESVQINTGLLALGNVISALSDPKKKKIGHIPYRDSKITRVLKDSLGGNAHTVMITCISPSSTSFAETINALKYANRAKNITNKPVVNRDPQQILIEEMQDEIEELKQQLQSRPTTREVAMEKQKLLEQEVQDLQNECRLYKDQVSEATRYFKVICSGRQIGKAYMKKWLQSVSDNGSFLQSLDTNASQILSERNDDQLLANKDAQIDELGLALSEARDDAREKEESLQIAEEMKEQQSEKLIEQNVIIEQLQEEILYLREEFNLQLQNAAHSRNPPPGNFSTRAHSVPHPSRGTWFSTESRLLSDDAKRAHSSPPLISAERVMAGFRARNHVIADRIEEENEVDHKAFVIDDSKPFQETVNETGGISERNYTSRKLENFAPQQQQWRIHTAKKLSDAGEDVTENADSNLNELRQSTILSVRRLKESELRAQNSNNKIRELSINIRMKEELIKELVRTGNDAEAVNREYLGKILQLQREVQTAKRELLEAHRVLQSQKSTGGSEQDMQKLKAEYEQKLKVAKSKVQMLQKKQRETENIANIPTQNRKKIKELELGIGTMRQMQEDMQKKLKLEQDRKRKLESILTRDQAKIKELELKNKNQEKVLKRKTEEVVAIQRKLRSAKSGSGSSRENVNGQKQWLDEEIERAIEQQNLLKQLEEALRAREAAVIRREEVLQQKEALETKKLRSSQVITSEVLQVASKLATVDQKLHARTQQLRDSCDRSLQGSASNKQQQLKTAVEHLQTEKTNLENKKKALEDKLQDGLVLNPQDERELIELDEAVEALTAAIEWQDDTIVHTSTSADVRESRLKLARERNSALQKHMKNLNGVAAEMLLTKCFERVIELRESEQALESRMTDLEAKLSNRDQAVMDSESALNRYVMESDRKLMEMEKRYEQRTQQLIKQLSDHDSTATGQALTQELQNRIETLQKDLQHYRSSNRELKKKLRDMLTESGADIPLSVRSNTETDIKVKEAKKDTTEETTPDVIASGSVPSSARFKAPEKKIENGGDPKALSNPKRLSKRSSQNQMSGDSANLEADANPPPNSKSTLNGNGFASLRRSRQEPPTTYTSISKNSVEYLEFQNLQSASRITSSSRRLNSGSDLSHQPPSSPSANLITALSTENLNLSGTKIGSTSLVPGFFLDTMPESGALKASKIESVVTPVRVSKKDIKRISKNEVNQRKTTLSGIPDNRGSASLAQSGLQDSLDAHKNPR